MTGKFLIDLTDARFFIPANDDVLSFVRTANPAAHSDVGSVLLDLGRAIPGSHAYSPSFRSCAYVVLHTDDSRIFGIAFGQHGLALRVGAGSVDEAVRDGGEPAPKIGADWVQFPPWNARGTTAATERLTRWCSRAFEEAIGAGR